MKYFSLFGFVVGATLVLFVCVLVVCAPVAVPRAHAQFNSPLPTSVNVDLEPTTPKPYDTVTATLSSYSTDLNGATITWSVNDKKVQSGEGQLTFSFAVGAANTTTKLDITIVTSAGEKITKTYSIEPTSVDLIWQATGYTPPFYKGKTLFSHQDVIEFIALPHFLNSNGTEIPPQNLIYTWTRNGTVVGDFSGYGKYTYAVQSSIVSIPLDIQVEVTSPNTSAVGSAELTATPVDPMALMYENNPLYGIEFQKALTDGTTLTGSKEINVIGEPYYFGTTNSHDASLSYNWSINGSTIDSDTSETTRTFREPDNTNGGQSNISLTVNNSNQILQSATYGFNLIFGKTTTAVTQTTATTGL